MTRYNSEQKERIADVSRRKFLKYAIGGVAGAAILAVHGNAILSGSNKESGTPDVNALYNMEKSSFSGHEGETFTVSKGAFDIVDLELTEVSDVIFNNGARKGEVFSLLFKGQNSYPLEQGTYVINNNSMAPFPLFIVPVYPKTHAMYYEAIFNRLEA
ncbi:DUF6916 family protein [Chloroflexota bacterium]